jgi:hypothetical protein
MKEKIPSLIAFCNRSILAWYRESFPDDIDDFTPVDKNDEEVIDIIYDMYLIVKADTKIQMLMPVIKYYFAIAVVEYCVLDCLCPLFTGVITKQMIGFSMNPNLSKYRQKMMGFSQQLYQVKTIQLPYTFKLYKDESESISL